MTYEKIKSGIKSNITSVSTIEGSFADSLVSPVSLEIENAYREFSKILDFSFITAMTGDYLTARAFEYGVSRKDGTFATGDVCFYGADGTVIPKGTYLSTKSGLLYLTDFEVVIEDGEADCTVTAEKIGKTYNLNFGVIDTVSVAISGVTSVTNTSEITSGTEIESDSELLERLLFVIQTPETSGNSYHYKQWCLEVSGVLDCKVFPLYYGNGTVMIMAVASDGRAPSDEIISNISSHIEENRPIGASVTVLKPDEKFLNITATISALSDVDTIKTAFEIMVNSYILSNLFTVTTIDTNRILSFLYNIDGVSTVSEILINGSADNISLGDHDIAVLGEIELVVI